jgi:hypothetical protein
LCSLREHPGVLRVCWFPVPLRLIMLLL